MKLSKGRKITAFVTLSILLVAVVTTACLLTVPATYRNPEAIGPTNTSASPQYGINQYVPSTSNASVAYIDVSSNGEGGYVKVLYPSVIYMDKTENLTDSGYYIAYDSYSYINNRTGVNPSGHGTGIFDNIFGSYGTTFNGDTTAYGNARTMETVFTAYGAESYDLLTTSNSQHALEVDNLDKDGNRNHGVKARVWEHTKDSVGSVVGVKIPLTGTINDTYKNKANVGATYSASNPVATYEAMTGFTLAYSEWYGNIWVGSKDWKPLTASTGFSNGGVTGNFASVPGFASVSYASGVTMKIVIYDKSALNAAVERLKPLATDEAKYKDVLNEIMGDNNFYTNFVNSFNAQADVLTSREVSQVQIDNATAVLNGYFAVKDFTYSNISTQYNGVNVNLASYWSGLNLDFYNVKVNGAEVTSADQFAVKNVGDYTLEVAPKKTVSYEGQELNLRWANYTDDPNEYKTIGTIKITPINIEINNVSQKVKIPYKNSAYNVTFATTAPSELSYEGSGNGDDGSGNQYFTNLYEGNRVSVQLSTDKETWSNSIPLTDIGTSTIYYKVTADTDNYNDRNDGVFTVEIAKAELTLAFSGNIEQTYGEAKLNSAQILAKSMISCVATNALDESDKNWADSLIGQIFTLRVASKGETYNGNEYLGAGEYDILADVNADWQDKVATSVNYDGNTYEVLPKSVSLTWSNTSSYYDGDTGHRSQATIASSELVAKDQAKGMEVKATVSLKDGGNAINAGTYDVTVSLDNSNYTYSDTQLSAGRFTINPRPITVTLSDRARTYGSSGNVMHAWDAYMNSFKSSVDVAGVFSVAFANGFSDGKTPLVDLASNVFAVKVATTANDYTSGNSAEPVYEGAPADRYFKVNESGYAISVEDIGNSNYTLVSCVGAKFVVSPATILFTESSLESKTYNGQEQTIAIENDKLQERMSGYESANYTALFADGIIKVEYKVAAPSAYATSDYTTDLKLKQAQTYDISYRITAPNHTTRVGSVRIQINVAEVYIDFTHYDGAHYGDAIPDSDTLKDLLKVKFYSSANKTSELEFAKEIAIRLIGSGGDDTLSGNKVKPGKYSASYVRDDAVSANYNIRYTQLNGADSNIGAYEIKKKELHIIWEQTGSGWAEDGMTFTYNGNKPLVTPVADSADIVSGDSITPAEPNWDRTGGNVGTYTATTSLSLQDNRENYEIVNPTATFTIVPRLIKIQIKNQTATYGNASTVPLGTSLINPSSADALWGYASGSLQFVNGEYSNFKLTSDAQNPTGGAKYVDVGNYDIQVEAMSKGSQADQNYTFEVVKDGVEGENGFNATFSITRAAIHYTGRQFNIQYDFADTSNNTEKNYVSQDQVRARISTATQTPLSEFNIEMTQLLAWTADLESAEGKDGESYGLSAIQATDPAPAVGRYYLFVKITHPTNFNTFYSKIEVNIQTDWVSITIIGDGIKASYGDATHSSVDIFNGLKEKDQIAYIGGIINPETNHEDKDYALSLIEDYVNNGKIEFFVGMGDTITQMTTNSDFGDYSIFIKVVDSTLDKNFRFLDEDNKSGTGKPTTNINVYHVGKRVVIMNWGKDGSMDEVYGEHSDSLTDPSPSHVYSIANPMPGDNVRITVTYYKKENGRWVQIPQGDHGLEVGEYLARATAVSHDNYEVPTGDGNWLEKEFEITKKSLTIKLNDRSDLTYGAPNATRDNINHFLNVYVDGIVRYNILNGDSFAYDDTVADVFKFALDFTLESGYTYLHAGNYTITYDKTFVNPNYDITFQDGMFTIGKAAASNVHYTQAQINNVTYTGKDISLIQSDILDRISLIGDGVELLNAHRAIKFSCRLQGTTDFVKNLTVKHARTYTLDIQIDAPNHEVQTVTGINFTVSQAVVNISMTQADKIYGDTLSDMLEGTDLTTFSDWLKLKCNIKLHYAGTIEGIDEDFEFIVIDSSVDPDVLTGITQLVPGTSHNVGTYRVYVNIDKLNGNYSFDFEQKAGQTFKCNANAYRIVPRDAEVTWKFNGAEVTSGTFKTEYTASAIEIIPYVTDIADGQEKQLDATGRNTDVGTGTAKVSVDKTNADNLWMNNYNFVGDTFNYEITRKNATVNIHNNSVVYGSDEAKLSFWKDGVQDYKRFDVVGANYLADFIRLTVNATSSRDYLAVATYNIEGKCLSNNYNVTWNKGTLTVNEVDINNNNEKKYSQPYNGADFVANVKDILAKGNYYTLAGDMTWNDATVSYNASDAIIKGIGSSDVEYTIEVANHATITGTLTIEVVQAELWITLTKGAKSVYGSSLLTSSELFKYAKLNIEQSTLKTIDLSKIITLKVNIQGDKVNSGSYTYAYDWINADDAEYYSIHFDDTNVLGIYEVTRKEISVTWNYDADTKYVYNGFAHRVEYQFSGVIGSDKVEIASASNVSAVNAGTYTASVEGLAGEDSDNYTFGSSSKLEWRILPKEIDVEWTAGDFTYNGAPHMSAIQKMAVAKTSDLANGDVCEIYVNVEWEDRIYAGKHMAVAESTNSNYVVRSATATFEFEIKKALIYITWDKDSLIYNGELQAPTPIIEGNQLVAGDECHFTVEGAQRNVKSSGNYVATATIDNPNYEIVASTASTAFNIIPKAITFDWNGVNTELTYIGEPQAPNPNAIGKIEGDEVEFTFDGMQENVGTGYVATVTGIKGNANYVIDWDSQTAVATVTFSIGKGVNGFKEEGFKLPAILDKLPWIDSKPEVKFGQDNLVVKYYSDKNLSKEVTNIDKAGEGKYWVTVFVAGTDNYDDFYQVFEVEVQGSLNVAIIILASVTAVILLAGALIVVLTTNKSGKKNKQEEGGAE